MNSTASGVKWPIKIRTSVRSTFLIFLVQQISLTFKYDRHQIHVPLFTGFNMWYSFALFFFVKSRENSSLNNIYANLLCDF